MSLEFLSVSKWSYLSDDLEELRRGEEHWEILASHHESQVKFSNRMRLKFKLQRLQIELLESNEEEEQQKSPAQLRTGPKLNWC